MLWWQMFLIYWNLCIFTQYTIISARPLIEANSIYVKQLYLQHNGIELLWDLPLERYKLL